MSDAAPSGPVLRVVRGNPTPEEVAALVTVLAALAAARPAAPAAVPASRWTSRSDAVGRAAPVGPDTWRTSAWPR